MRWARGVDVNNYDVYYKKAATIADLAGASAAKVDTADSVKAEDCFNGETGAVYYDGKAWVFASVASPNYPGRNALYGWYSVDGASWTAVGPFWDDKLAGSLHHDEVVFGGEVWVVEGAADGDCRTRHGDPYNLAAWPATQVGVGYGSGGGMPHFLVEGGELYLGGLRMSPRSNVIHRYNAGSWVSVASITSAGWDVTMFKVGTSYYFAQAPWTGDGGGRQWIKGWTSNAMDAFFFDGGAKLVTEGKFDTNTWTDMWPIGFTDAGGDSYLFYGSERDPSDPSPSGPDDEVSGNIWYLPVLWTTTNDHYTYMEEAQAAAEPGDTIVFICHADGECDDGIDCTDDTCGVTHECVFTPNDAVCPDDGDPCTDAVCDPVTGCGAVYNTATCDDGDPETFNDTCYEGTCTGTMCFDMSYNGWPDIIFDVPLFVDCVYHGSCNCPGPEIPPGNQWDGCLVPGDCNDDGMLTIVGDVECFVNCIYFENCPCGLRGAPARSDGLMIGGAVYSDAAWPLHSGLSEITVEVFDAQAEPVATTVTDDWGIWRVEGLTPGRYTLRFADADKPLPGAQRVRLQVDAAHEAANQSLQLIVDDRFEQSRPAVLKTRDVKPQSWRRWQLND